MRMASGPDKKVVAIVAPSGYTPNEAALLGTEAIFADHGWQVRRFFDPARRHQRFGAEDSERAAQLHAAAADPEVTMVLALRGGYGMSRLLHALDFDSLAASGKLFVGHSDFTVFHLGLLARTGAISFAGPMLDADFLRAEPSAFTLRHFFECLGRPEHSVSFEALGNPDVDLDGRLWGGNLTMLTHMLGTPYFPAIEGGILFVEDVNEHPYRVERMLLQLFHAGVLARQHALVLGDFSNYRLSDYDNGYDFAAMLDYLRGQLGIPVLTGLPFGHVRDKVTLPVGCMASLSCVKGAARLTMRDYPCLP